MYATRIVIIFGTHEDEKPHSDEKTALLVSCILSSSFRPRLLQPSNARVCKLVFANTSQYTLMYPSKLTIPAVTCGFTPNLPHLETNLQGVDDGLG
jgi:hypothetical protein